MEHLSTENIEIYTANEQYRKGVIDKLKLALTNHTPAPWAIDDCVDYIDIIDANKNTIVVVENDNQHNAKLISAAPELLEALIAILEYPYAVLPIELWDKARTAITKATGE